MESVEPRDRDPGWRGAAVAALPGYLNLMRVRRAKARAVDPITTLRRVHVAFVSLWVQLAIPVIVLDQYANLRGNTGPKVWAIVIVALGIVANVLVRVLQRSLPLDSAAHLAGAYQSRYFLRSACANVLPVLGFVGFVQSATVWLYPLAAGPALLAGIQNAPTRRAFAAEQRRIEQRGSSLSLVDSLLDAGRAANATDGDGAAG